MPSTPRSSSAHSLGAYKKKRNFAKTPEPSGDERSSKARTAKVKKRIFCVQKHAATRLHYDFRLEHRGVLLSWAVPKGPSLRPEDKRLAVQVEDHPLDYVDFEGVIPEGYGAGTVMLWDKGTWEPENGEVDTALEKGELKFSLDGFKLKGSWVLVRTRVIAGKQQWLLIKHEDEWAGNVDIESFAPLSVKSDKSLEEIAGTKGVKQWNSNREGGKPEKGTQKGVKPTSRRARKSVR
jgi:bifunctional non-homologous end joining protein LigD